MSLIGPRPVRQDELEKYDWENRDWSVSVKSGITGMWQVSGKHDLDYDKRVALDVCYIRNWTLWLDLIIAVRTARTGLRMEGAY
ncbi:MAG: sugar transferase [Salinibacter sp.]